MKQKLKIIFCVLMISVLFFANCISAYAYTGGPTDLDKAVSIVSSYYDISKFSVFVLSADKSGNTVLVCLPGSITLSSDNYLPNSIGFSGSVYNDPGSATNWLPADTFLFDSTNMYSKPTLYHAATNDFTSIPYPNGKYSNGNTFSVIESSHNIYNTETSELVFHQGTSVSPNPTPPTPSGSNILLPMFNSNSGMLNGVLQEIVKLLPILLPVLITFLAIRKGLKFCLLTLRSS